MIELIVQAFAYLFLAVSAACAVIGSIGMVRFPDVYNRIHAQTVVVVGGVILAMLGVSLLEGISIYTLKALSIAIFIFLTSPVASHAIARAAHKSGVKLWPKSVADKLAEEKP